MYVLFAFLMRTTFLGSMYCVFDVHHLLFVVYSKNKGELKFEN